MQARWSCYPHLLATAFLLCAGCGDDTVELKDVRQRKREPGRALSAAERFDAGAHHGADPHAGLNLPGRAAAGHTWQTPAGWEEQPAAGLREAAWRVASAPDTDCSLIVLRGMGGSLEDNVKRWATEMGIAPADVPAAEGLPRLAFLGGEAAYLDLRGTYSGGSARTGRVEQARLLGLVRQMPGETVFLKFTGPAATVEAEKAAFEALAASVKRAAPAMPVLPPGHGGGAEAPFKWSGPEGWQLQPPRMMRLFTYHVGASKDTWCYASILRGDGGGVAANVNRWRSEMGQSALSAEQLAALERVEVLGTPGVLLDVSGDFRGTGGPAQKGARLFGLVCPLEGRVLFVKMVGPAPTMEAHKDAFRALCRSVRP